MIRRPPRSTLSSSSAASDGYKRQEYGESANHPMFRGLSLSIAGLGLVRLLRRASTSAPVWNLPQMLSAVTSRPGIVQLQLVDSHTMGQPTRCVVGGFPELPQGSMAVKKAFMAEHLDGLRTAVMLEPRGHSDMFGSFITPPVSQGAHFGVIFCDAGGYLNMCGHGTIGAVTIAIETGIVAAIEPVTTVIIDTPASVVTARATVKDGRVLEVALTNVPSFVLHTDVTVQIPDFGAVTLDIAFGGSFFAIIDARKLNLTVTPGNIQTFQDLGPKIRDAVNAQVEIVHPTLPHVTTVDLCEFYDDPTHPDATYKNVVVFGDGQFDRSPCGTGTSAKLALMYAKGEIVENAPFVYESVTGTLFRGRVLEQVTEGGVSAVRPEVVGSGYITGFSTAVLDDQDPFRDGFRVG
eukprot:TRINITY_DN4321_c0_g1_i10.p1 TRINITY_DN4321_c0_g1~~TRINITY_DN4321_c0_g1_i10.p1  ORF type:complete len:407 (+),score=86.30 TRINITY_DN4321_c0_g1_i10:96-1316(+)